MLEDDGEEYESLVEAGIEEGGEDEGEDEEDEVDKMLQPLIVEEPFMILGLDWIGPLPEGLSGNRFILQMIDYLSRFSWTRASPNATKEVHPDANASRRPGTM